jgi:uncharacterized alpha-E superfamily protein
MSPTEYSKEKGGYMHMGHVSAMKSLHRSLQDMHDNLQSEVEYSQPPKPLKLKEEADLFNMFDDSVKERLEAVYEAVDDDCKQIINEMLEAEEYDELVSIIDEVNNG